MTHIDTRLHQRIDIEVVFIVLTSEKARDTLVLLQAEHLQKTSNLGLEDHNHSDNTYADKLPQNARKKLHIERSYHHIHQVEHHHTQNDTESIGAARYAIEIVEHHRHQKDVDDINYADVNESHCLFRLFTAKLHKKKKTRNHLRAFFFCFDLSAD